MAELRKYQEVKQQLLQLIQQMAEDQQLPGERELAKQFGFSYMTIRHAVDDLVAENILYRRPRRGTFVQPVDQKTSTTGNIGFFLYEKLQGGITSPYYSMVFKAMQMECLSLGYNLIYFTNSQNVDTQSVDGIIATAFPEMKQQIAAISRGRPTIMIDNDVFDVNLPAIVIDNYNSTCHAIEYAYNIGHRKIGFITGLQSSSVGIKRLAGYKTVIEQYKLPQNPDYLCIGDYSYDCGKSWAQHYASLSDRPTFIHCANDMMAMGLIKGFAECGVSVPDDISVSGFDDIDMAKLFHPSLTTMAVDLKAMAKQSMAILMEGMRTKKTVVQKVMIPAKLIVRESTKPLPLPGK